MVDKDLTDQGDKQPSSATAAAEQGLTVKGASEFALAPTGEA